MHLRSGKRPDASNSSLSVIADGLLCAPGVPASHAVALIERTRTPAAMIEQSANSRFQVSGGQRLDEIVADRKRRHAFEDFNVAASGHDHHGDVGEVWLISHDG